MKRIGSMEGNVVVQRKFIQQTMKAHADHVRAASPCPDIRRWRDPEDLCEHRLHDGKKKLKQKEILKRNTELVDKIYDIMQESRERNSSEYCPGWRVLTHGGRVIDCYQTKRGCDFAAMHSGRAKQKREAEKLQAANDQLRWHVSQVKSVYSAAVMREDYEKHKERTRCMSHAHLNTALHLDLHVESPLPRTSRRPRSAASGRANHQRGDKHSHAQSESAVEKSFVNDTHAAEAFARKSSLSLNRPPRRPASAQQRSTEVDYDKAVIAMEGFVFGQSSTERQRGEMRGDRAVKEPTLHLRSALKKTDKQMKTNGITISDHQSDHHSGGDGDGDGVDNDTTRAVARDKMIPRHHLLSADDSAVRSAAQALVSDGIAAAAADDLHGHHHGHDARDDRGEGDADQSPTNNGDASSSSSSTYRMVCFAQTNLRASSSSSAAAASASSRPKSAKALSSASRSPSSSSSCSSLFSVRLLDVGLVMLSPLDESTQSKGIATSTGVRVDCVLCVEAQTNPCDALRKPISTSLHVPIRQLKNLCIVMEKQRLYRQLMGLKCRSRSLGLFACISDKFTAAELHELANMLFHCLLIEYDASAEIITLSLRLPSE